MWPGSLDRPPVVQVSSALADCAIPIQAAYCAAKHAILGFTDSLRSELLHERSRVKVTRVHLPAVNARTDSLQLWMTVNRTALAVVSGGVAGLLGLPALSTRG